jgi:hypothetical protein
MCIRDSVKGQNVEVAIVALNKGTRIVLEVQSDEFISPATFANVLYDVTNAMPKRFNPRVWGAAMEEDQQVSAQAEKSETDVQS